MKIKVVNDINYFKEALFVLSKAFDNYYEKNKIIDYDNLNISKKNFDNENKDIIEYFKVIDNSATKITSNYADLSEMFSSADEFPSIVNFFIFSELKKSIKKYSKKELVNYCKHILAKNLDYNDGLKNDSEKMDPLTLLDELYILNNNQKYTLLKLFNNTSGILDRFYEMISKTEDILKDNFYLIEKVYFKIRETIKKIDVFKLKHLSSKTTQPLVKEADNCEVYLSINFFEECSLSVFLEEETKLSINIGFLKFFLKDFYLGLDEKKEETQKKLAVLSDNTRFNILYMLSKGKKFGKEISEELDISKATVSYHLNYLINENFIKVESDGKKIFYSLNKEGFGDVLNYLNIMIGEKNERN